MLGSESTGVLVSTDGGREVSQGAGHARRHGCVGNAAFWRRLVVAALESSGLDVSLVIEIDATSAVAHALARITGDSDVEAGDRVRVTASVGTPFTRGCGPRGIRTQSLRAARARGVSGVVTHRSDDHLQALAYSSCSLKAALSDSLALKVAFRVGAQCVDLPDRDRSSRFRRWSRSRSWS